MTKTQIKKRSAARQWRLDIDKYCSSSKTNKDEP